MPAIALILDRSTVHGMEAANQGQHTDYRKTTTPSSVCMVYSPRGQGSERTLAAVFAALTDAPPDGGAPATVPVMMGRTLEVPHAADGVACIGFAELCGQV